MVSLRVHCESSAAQTYNIDDAMNSLATFMQMAKEVESAELSKKFNSIMLALKAALWIKLPPQVVLPKDVVRVGNSTSTGQNQPNQGQDRNQVFEQAGRNAWGPTRGWDPMNFRGQGQRRGQGQTTGQGCVRGQGHLSQPNIRKTLQQMVNLLADILQ